MDQDTSLCLAVPGIRSALRKHLANVPLEGKRPYLLPSLCDQGTEGKPVTKGLQASAPNSFLGQAGGPASLTKHTAHLKPVL